MTKKTAVSAQQNSSVLTLRSPENRPLRGAYSKPLRRGVLGDLDGRSKEGRYLKTIERDLIEQVGGSPSVGQQLLIRRIARAMLMLEILDLKLASNDNWNQCDAATQGGLNNNVRLCLRELGIKGPTPKRQDLASYLAEKAANNG
jgi:hypothetical protein